ncbi:sperizin, RING finger protein, putative [Pediculus humanus corporis]|uniref:RING-type E3 ubiquitin transferase n=1 Tax=Pediculus humanus subsp. corporis TaxID=121224 RepID=E0VBX7_PEDHC|nr:sperizin, RING finger protein, putative [Pediculus humanus corporis]EEB10883.1 sperizin, RING finger protein, putative [Pediculus humanus corporis]
MFVVKNIFKKLFLFFLLKLANCDILVYNLNTSEVEIEFKDVPSKFGDAVPPEGITKLMFMNFHRHELGGGKTLLCDFNIRFGFNGFTVYSNPPDACEYIEKPPNLPNYNGKWIVLIRRYGCEFEIKVRNAQIAGYDAAIVHNVNSSVLKPMAADNPNMIRIPSIFISSDAGLLIKMNYLYDNGYYILITDDIPFNFTSQLLIIFSVLIGFCFFVILFFLIVKYFKDRRRQRRYCLPKSSLKKITVHKFKKNDPYEICAICLEEYVENDKLRVLPCSHAYHSKCIDPWLTKKRRVCPVCKRKVFASGETVADFDSETEDETTPLVRNTGNGTTNAGTFAHTGSDFGSISTVPSSRTDSLPSLADASRQTRRTGRIFHFFFFHLKTMKN